MLYGTYKPLELAALHTLLVVFNPCVENLLNILHHEVPNYQLAGVLGDTVELKVVLPPAHEVNYILGLDLRLTNEIMELILFIK